MGLFSGPERRSWIPEPPIPSVYGGGYGGSQGTSRPSQSLRTDQALLVPSVWACVALLSNAVSMLPLETYRRTDGLPARITDPQLVTNPSGEMTQSEWLHMLMVSLLLRGNAYGHVRSRDQRGYPTQVELLNPDQVTVKVDPDSGVVTYEFDDRSGRQKHLPAEEVWHVRGMTMPGSKVGLSPISYAAATIGVDLASREFASDFFDGGGVPKAILKTTQPVSQDQSQVLKARLLASFRRREPMVLSHGLDYQQISVKPEESQFLATQQANVAQVARFFSIPPEMIGGSGGNSLTYANVEQRQLDFFTLGVAFWLKRIEDAMFGLFPAQQYVRFNASALLRTDAETAAKVDVQLIAAKIKVPSEVRFDRNLPPMTEAQKSEADMVPLTITPLGSAKALPALHDLPGPVAPVPANDQQGAIGV